MSDQNPQIDQNNIQQVANADPQVAGTDAQAAVPGNAFAPRHMSFFTLVLKTLAGFAGGVAGTLVLLLIFLSSSSILQPVLSPAIATEAASGEPSPLFMVVLMAMVFATSIVSSMLSTLLLAYTERERYTRIATTMSQVFIVNIVIFAFVLPIYLTTSTTHLQLTAFAAILQVILSSMASAMILELIHDHRYALIAVYTTILAILVASGINFFLYFMSGNATITLFAAQPIIWGLIGFSQSAFAMLYYWIYQTWGSDFLANSANFGGDYGVSYLTEEEEEEVEIAKNPDVEGTDFLNK